MENQEFEVISNQITTLSNSLKDAIKNVATNDQKIVPVFSDADKNSFDTKFNSFLESASNLFSAPTDIKPLIAEKYKKQSDQITKLKNDIKRYFNDTNLHTKKFNESIDEETHKFNRSLNNLVNNYYDQKEMHASNHEAQISNLDDSIYKLKANYEAKLSDGLKKVAAEKKLLQKVYQSFQKNYNDMKVGLGNNLKDQNDTDEEEEKSINKNINFDENESYSKLDDDNVNYNDATGSSEVKTRAYMGDILNKIDEIEEIEQENKKLADQIEKMKIKNDSEIAQLKNQLTQIETDSESRLSSALKSNQEKYDNEFEAIRSKYSQIESELIKKLNGLKKEQSSTNNNLRSELSKVKAISNSCKVKLSKRMKEAENISQSKIHEKEMQVQNLKKEHAKAIYELNIENQNEIEQINPENNFNSSSCQSTSIRRKLSQVKQKVTQPQTPRGVQSPRNTKLPDDEKIDISDTKAIMDKINSSENESRQRIAQYSELKNNLQAKISDEQINTLSQLSEIEKATEISQGELNELSKKLDELQLLISNSISIPENEKEIVQQQNEEINNKKDEINRLRIEVNKRKTLQAIQSHHHQEINQIDENIQKLIQDSFTDIQQKSEDISNEQTKTNDAIKESFTKLDTILNELKEAKIDEEEVSIKERQKWSDIRSDIANSTIALCNQNKAKNTSRPTSSAATSRPIVSPSKLPPLQKSQS